MKILVSIINWNTSGTTNTCLESLLKLSDQNFDIHLIDNGSEEEFVVDGRLLSRYGKRLRQTMNALNVGFGAAHNQSAEIAVSEKYDFLIILNNDTKVIDDRVFAKLLSALTEHDRAFASAPTIISRKNPDTIWYGGGEFKKLAGDVQHKNVGVIVDSRLLSAKTASTEFTTGCCLAIRVSMIGKLNGLFDEDFFLYYEDGELSRRAINKNLELLYVPSAKLLHEVSSSLGRRSSLYAYYNIRNKLLFNRKINNLGPTQLIHTFFIAFKFTTLAILREQSKIKKMVFIYRALRDGITGKTGKSAA